MAEKKNILDVLLSSSTGSVRNAIIRKVEDDDKKIKEAIKTFSRDMTPLSPEELEQLAEIDAATIQENEGADHAYDVANNIGITHSKDEPGFLDKRLISAAFATNTGGKNSDYYSSGLSKYKTALSGFFGGNESTDYGKYEDVTSRVNSPTQRLSRYKFDAVHRNRDIATPHNEIFEPSPYSGEVDIKKKFYDLHRPGEHPVEDAEILRVKDLPGFDPQRFIDRESVASFIDDDKKSYRMDKSWREKDGKVDPGTSYGDLGTYSMEKGEDKNGHYIEIYDYNDYDNKGATEAGFNDKPFHVLDRIYYDPRTRKVYDPFKEDEYKEYKSEKLHRDVYDKHTQNRIKPTGPLGVLGSKLEENLSFLSDLKSKAKPKEILKNNSFKSLLKKKRSMSP